ncbi:MAG: glycosyltransferase [Cyanobacteria bacterium P01_A01_bin.3]
MNVTPPTRICITTLEFPPDIGGVGESVQRIAMLLSESGYEVHIAVFHSKQYKTATETCRGGVQTQQQGDLFVHRINAAVRGETPVIYDYKSEVFFQLKQLHHQYQFELFHAFFLNETGFLTTLLAKELGVPVINSIRGSDLHKHIFSAKNHSHIVWTLENSDYVTSVSLDLLHRAQTLVPSLKGRSTAFWNSIAPIDMSSLPTPDPVPIMRGPVIGSVGRFREKKGLEFLLDACRELSAELEFTLLLVGDFAERERDYWLQEIEDSGLGDRIVVTGMKERLEAMAHLPLMDVFAIPSLHDGCPNAMLEAMLAGKAIVGSSADAIGEILDHGFTGLVVSPGSSPDLALALRTLLTNPGLRQRLGQAARKQVLSQLAPPIEQQNWAIVYAQALGRHASVAQILAA